MAHHLIAVPRPVTPGWYGGRSQPPTCRFTSAEWSVAVADAHA
ncbi:hypothetical protein [Micromonospora craniellae]|nr:hypothetical protein [Micromonospora craniellae]